MTDGAKRCDPIEGPEAAQRFERTMDRLLRVSKEELAEREAAYKQSRRSRKLTRQPEPDDRSPR